MVVHKIIFTALFMFLFCLSTAQTQETNRISIAVLDFKNISKNKGYDFLEQTVSESLTTSLQKSGKFNIVERRNLMAIMEEKKLYLSGIADEDIKDGRKIGTLVSADHLILGSISSAGDRIEINARVVRVDTGEVILAENITEKMGDMLFARLNDLADEIILRLTGEKTGFLDIDSTPGGAEVKIGEKALGNTPITGKKMKVGKYTATVVLANYDIRNLDFEITENKKTSLDIPLEKKPEKIYENWISLQSHMIDLMGNNYQLDWGLSYERMFGNFSFGLEFGGLMLWNSYQDTNAPGPVFSDTQFLYYHRGDVELKYYLFPGSSFISPYAGAGIGFTLIDNSVYELIQTQLYWKGIAGLCLFPSSGFSVFLEAIYHNPGFVTINEKRFNLFGDYNLAPVNISLQNVLLGLGIRVGF